MKWSCQIPGKASTPWSGGVYKGFISFPEDYPSKPPKFTFVPPIFHPNVYPSGAVCLSILNESEGWRPAITVKQVILGVRDLLDNPNNSDAAQQAAYDCFNKSRVEYDKKIKEQAKRFTPKD